MKKLITILLTVHASLFTLHSGEAQIIHVPADQPTIQAGIDAAADGDTVLVAEDTYPENINFLGKDITVASHYIIDGDTNHINNTIIDGSQPVNPDLASVVTFITGEDSTSVLCGFTITGGTGMNHPALTARVGGGIVCFFAGAKIIHNKITGNGVASPIHALGGGIYGESAPGEKWIIISGNTIANNQCIAETGNAQGGGGEIVGDARIIDNIITGNYCSSSSSQAWGGGISQMSADNPSDKVFFVNNVFHDNTIVAGGLAFGAGLNISHSEAHLSNNQITSNTAVGDSCLGGGLSLDNPANVNFINNLIAHNKMVTADSYWFGAGVRCYLPQGTVVIRNNEFSYNSGPVAPIGAGAALSIEEGYDFPVIIDANKFQNDTAYHGGGVFERSSWNIHCHNNLFTGNYTFRGGAIGLYHPAMSDKSLKNISESFQPLIINNTFSNNYSANDAGAIRSQCEINPPEILNCIFWQNSAPLGKDIYNWMTLQMNISFSDIDETAIMGPWTGTENINEDPQFTGSGEHPYSLTESSPCIDLGTPDTTGLNLPIWDIIGNFRLWDGDGDLDTIIDMGAYEYGSTPFNVGILTITQNSKFKIQNYPNPTRGIVDCRWSMVDCRWVTVKVYDLDGREVMNVMDMKLPEGEHTVRFDMTELPAGMYFVRFQAGGDAATGKIVLQK